MITKRPNAYSFGSKILSEEINKSIMWERVLGECEDFTASPINRHTLLRPETLRNNFIFGRLCECNLGRAFLL